MMSSEKNSAMLVVGVGSPHGDDQAGWLAVEALRGTQPPARTITAKEPLSLIAELNTSVRLWIVDSLVPAGSPGRIRRWRWNAEQTERVPAVSTHGVGIESALLLAASLGKLPPEVIIYGIEAESFVRGGGLSRSVEAQLPTLVRRLSAELSEAVHA